MIEAYTKSPEDTQLLAQSLAEIIRPKDLILLIGEIGAGKTTFTQGFARGLGIEEPITSPTFVLIHSYEADITLHHVDVYRLEHLQEVIDLGLMELLDEGGVALIEWGNIALPVLPRDFLEIHLEIPKDDAARKISLRPIGNDWSAREKTVREKIANWIVVESEA